MRGRLVIGLLACLTLLAPTAAAGSHPSPQRGVALSSTSGVRTIDQIAESLRSDPVLVDPALGTGDAAGVDEVLTELASQLDVPVYVVLASIPTDLRTAEHPAEQAGALLNATLGEGLYIIHFTEGIGWVGGFGAAASVDTVPGQRAFTRAREIGPFDFNQPTAALEAELILRSAADPGRAIGDDQLREWIDTPRAFVPTEARDHVDQSARRWVVVIAAALAVLVAGLVLTAVGAAYPLRDGRRRGTQPAGSGPPQSIVVDEAALSRAQRRYDQLPLADLASPHATAAAEALSAADLVSGTGDPLDAVGGWVLAQQADRELDRIRRPKRVPFRPCVVNPQHGEASSTVRLSGSSIDAPACISCGRDRGAFLTASTWRGERRYLDTSSVWARTGFGSLVDDLARQVIADRTGR